MLNYIAGHVDGVVVDLSFASEQWQRLGRGGDGQGRLARRHFEACVFTYLADALRTGDVAVAGSQAYANWSAQLLPWQDCQSLLGGFCAEVALPATAAEFTEQLQATLVAKAGAVDAGYPDNADLVIDETTGVPSLKRRRGKDRNASAVASEETIKERDAGAFPCSTLWPAPPTGWTGGGVSGRRRARTPSWPTRSAVTS